MTDEQYANRLRSDAEQQGEPLGYCPHCDYQLVEIGTCPECGKAVSVKTLSIDPRPKRRRKIAKRVAWLLALIAGGVGLQRFYVSGYWHRWAPTDWLLATQPDERWHKGELLRRIKLGDLTDTQLDAWIEKRHPYQFVIQNPRPRHVPLQFRIKSGVTNAYRLADPVISHAAIRVEAIRLNGHRVAADDMPDTLSKQGGSIKLPWSLNPGTYELEVDIVVSIDYRPYQSNVSAPGLPHERAFTFTETIEVLDQGPRYFLNDRDDEALRDELKRVLRFSLCAENASNRVWPVSHCDHVPVALIGTFEMFVGDEETSRQTRDVGFGPNSGWTFTYDPITVPPGTLMEDMRVHVVFTPAALRLYESGWHECYFGQLEWSALMVKPIDEADPQAIEDCYEGRPPHGQAPDRFYAIPEE